MPLVKYIGSTLNRDGRIQVAQGGFNITWKKYYDENYNGSDPNWGGNFACTKSFTFGYLQVLSHPAAWSFWDSGRMHWTMTMKDYIAGTKDNHDSMTAIETANSSNPTFHTKYVISPSPYLVHQ
jgi:hypothetical protein